MKTFLFLILFSSWAGAQEIYELYNVETSKSAGVITVKDGAIFEVGGQKYKFRIVNSAELKKLKEGIMGEVNFADATLADAVRFFNAKIEQLPPSDMPPQITLKFPERAAGVTLGIQLKNVSYYDFLQTICFKTGYTYELSGKTVQLSPPVPKP